MLKQIQTISATTKEFLFQVILHVVLFSFYSIDKEHPHIGSHHFAFFLNYAVAAFIINYWLLPRFFYRKQYLTFSLWFLAIVALVIFVEETFLESIYFPGRRADTFPGVLFTSVQVLPVIIILVGFKFAWDAVNKQGEVEKLQAAVQESELQFLKSQINPHFLFNNLNNLYSYAIENSPKTPTIILELSSVLRYMLYECKEKYVPLSKELEQLENFTQLYELQIEERGEVNFVTHPIPGGYQIAPLILIVFIENAFKHSQASQSDNIAIDIEIKVSAEGQLDFYCANSFQPTSNTDKLAQGIGLENVRKRLELIYPNAHRLDIRETDNRYEVHLTIQLNKTRQA
jgi:hypothetical protein